MPVVRTAVVLLKAAFWHGAAHVLCMEEFITVFIKTQLSPATLAATWTAAHTLA